MSSHFDHVVVGYDFSHSGHHALRRAVALAERAPQIVLHVVCVIDPNHPIPSLPSYGGVDDVYAVRVQEALAFELQKELEAVDITGRIHFFVHARIGKQPADEILELARELGAALIVVGSHGLIGLERLLLGSTSEKIVREAGCSVYVARPRRYPDAELLGVVEVEPRHRVPPHRYEYEDHRVSLRPPEWPLY